MSYKPSEQELMAYLYDELEGSEKEKVEHYLFQNPEAKKELEAMRTISSMMGSIKDKEVIAPPIFVGDSVRTRIWDAPYLKTILGIAASLIVVILVARFSGLSVRVSGNEVRLTFGDAVDQTQRQQVQPEITKAEVREMIKESLVANNEALNTTWEQSQVKLAESISKNLVVNSDKMNQIVRQASSASKEQIEEYVSTLQADNMKLVKDYFTLTSGEQKQYIESLLVDFAKYLQQQRNDDLRLVQLRLNNIEQTNTAFKQETEQILTSIISSVGNPPSEAKY
jgi:hypothetical protein